MTTPAAFVRKAHEYDDVYSYYFHHPTLSYQAGRYAHLQLGSMKERLVQELSFASAPSEPELRFTVHTGSGSTFKKRLDALQPGERARVWMIRGRLRLPATTGRPLVFIAGGVGMAPFRSLILAARERGGFTTHLLQVQRGEFLYRDDVEPIVDSYEGVRPDDFLDGVHALATIPNALFYVCGSTRLVSQARAVLCAAGVRRRDLRIESFG